LNATFHVVDSELSKLSAEDGTHSGCTAVTAFLRLEDEHGNAVEVDEDPDSTIGSRVLQGGGGAPLRSSTIAEDSTSSSDVPSSNDNTEGEEGSKRKFGDGVHRERIKSLFGGSGSSPNATDGPPAASKDKQSLDTAGANEQPKDGISSEGVKRPARPKNMARRTLYTANVGDARAVLRCALIIPF
jgi:protein phosphatase PTC1